MAFLPSVSFGQGLALDGLPDRADVYALKPEGTGAGQRPKGREKWPDDYEVAFADEKFRLDPNPRRREEYQAGGSTRARGDWLLNFRHDLTLDSRMKAKGKTDGVSDRVFNLVGSLTGSSPITQVWEATEVR